MRNIDIAIIINSLNRFVLLKESLIALSVWIPNSKFNNRFVVVVYDAGSTDGSVTWLKEEAPKLGFLLEVIIPKAGDDTSFASGINSGVAYAVKSYPSLKYLLFYETDNQILELKPLEGALVQLEKRERLAACGFTVRLHGGGSAGVGQPFPSILNFALGKNIVDRLHLEKAFFKWQDDIDGISFSEIDVVYTSPLLVRLDAWKESGGLDASTFPFSDCDVDWARRLRDLGWKMGVIRTDAVIHDNRETLSAWSKSRAIQSHRSRLKYFKRYYPKSIFLAWPLLLLLRHLLELISTQFLIKEPVRRVKLSEQFYLLLKSTIRNYE
jgi:GT2 family glycosyltransferase